MNKKLSILIVTLKSRQHLFNNLKRILKNQLTDEVEVLVSSDEKENTIGAKRNELLKSATGEYVCFVDDDDAISPFYVSEILNAAKDAPDCIGIKGVITLKGVGPRIFIHSLQYKTWFEKDNIYYRCPNHLNPIKREIAQSVGFPLISNQEDKIYSHNIKDKLKTEKLIETPIYYYYPSSED
jgi:glycosyltransferase involved in cell wall biosynthesis